MRSTLLFSAAVIASIPVQSMAGCSLDGLSDGARAADAGSCVAGGNYCGGERIAGETNVLYRCETDGSGALVAKCANGCVVAPGENDRCSDARSCVPGGTYCGGDKVNGDPAVLYRCETGGEASVIERCPNGCRVSPPGTDDECMR